MTRIFAGCALLCLSCASGSGHPPIARITVAPAFVPLDDGYRTEVMLDGSGSRDEIDDPAGIQPLLYEWVVEDAKSQILPSADVAKVSVKIAGMHPVTVHLTVADGDDVKTTTSAQIGVTLP